MFHVVFDIIDLNFLSNDHSPLPLLVQKPSPPGRILSLLGSKWVNVTVFFLSVQITILYYSSILCFIDHIKKLFCNFIFNHICYRFLIVFTYQILKHQIKIEIKIQAITYFIFLCNKKNKKSAVQYIMSFDFHLKLEPHKI